MGMPDSMLPVPLPKGWSIKQDNPLQLACPEGDLALSFLVYQANVQEAIKRAWPDTDPCPTLRMRQETTSPSSDGWDSATQIFYDSGAGEDDAALLLVRSLGDRQYVNLARCTKAALSRRGAQMSELILAWKPSGLVEPSLAGVVPQQMSSSLLNALHARVEEAREKLEVPGVAMVVIQGGQVVFAEGFGVRALNSADPVTPSTRFMIGSSTKPMTSLLMARAVDAGLFAWDTPVQVVLPGFTLADPDVTARLTMRHTVCACTGMPRRDTELLFRYAGVTAEERMAEMAAMRPTTGFGETFQYSNYLVAAGGYAAAHSFAPGLSLAKAYESAMQSLVFAPLGMRSTTVHASPGENAAPHGRALDGKAALIDPSLEHFADPVAPAGSVWSTVLDMAEYVKAELNRGLNSAGERVVSEENLLQRRKLGIRINETSGYGLGLLLSEQYGLGMVGHGGNTLGFTSEMIFMPEHNLGYVVLTNMRAANDFLGIVHQHLLELVFGAAPKAEAMVAAAVQSRSKQNENLHRTIRQDEEGTAWIRQFVGRYASPELGRAEIQQGADGYSIVFEAWTSTLASAMDAGERFELVLTSAPWRGGLRLEAQVKPKALVLNGGQAKYVFAPL